MRTLFRTILLALMFALPTLVHAQNSTARYPLLEQFTGTWCIWCPYGADTLDAILNTLPNARAIAYHNNDPMATSEGDIVTQHLLVPGFPTGAIDRLLINLGSSAAIAVDRVYWRQIMTYQNQQTSPMSISVTGTYDQDTRQIAAMVTMNILADMSGEFYYNAVLTEDGLNYAQKKTVNGSTIILNPYYHKRVVRDMITGSYGTTLTSTGYTAGQTVLQNLNYTVPANYDINNCKLTIFVTKKVNLSTTSGPRPTQMAIQQSWQEPILTALTVIPVELISFNAAQDGADVRVIWRTASESNNSGWFVERRSADGEWSDLGFVAGRGTTNEQQQYEFLDRDVRPLEVYDYRLRQVDYDGTIDYSPISRLMAAPVPTETRLLPNYPNPFNPNTYITVELAEESDITVAVYDMLGRHVTTLASGVHAAGGHVFEWTGTDATGNAMPSGIYFTRLHTPTHSAMQQMQLSK